jgi:hypothetical protein
LSALSPELVGKRLELLTQAVPGVSRVAALWQPGAIGERTEKDMLNEADVAAREGALRNLGHRVARSTVATVLKDNGIPPAPDRPLSWRTFLRAHWGEIAGADFFTTEV